MVSFVTSFPDPSPNYLLIVMCNLFIFLILLSNWCMYLIYAYHNDCSRIFMIEHCTVRFQIDGPNPYKLWRTNIGWNLWFFIPSCLEELTTIIFTNPKSSTSSHFSDFHIHTPLHNTCIWCHMYSYSNMSFVHIIFLNMKVPHLPKIAWQKNSCIHCFWTILYSGPFLKRATLKNCTYHHAIFPL